MEVSLKEYQIRLKKTIKINRSISTTVVGVLVLCRYIIINNREKIKNKSRKSSEDHRYKE